MSSTVCPAWRGHSIVHGTVVWEVAVGSLPRFVSVDKRTPSHYPVLFYTPSKGKSSYSCFAKILVEFLLLQPLQLILYPTLFLSAHPNTESKLFCSGSHPNGLMCKTENWSEVSPNPNPKSKTDSLFSVFSPIIPLFLGNGLVLPPTLPILSSLLARERQRELSCLQCARASVSV